MLSTLLRPEGGLAVVARHDVATQPQAVRAAIGVTGQFSAVDKLLTSRGNLTLMARLHHIIRGAERDRRAGELLDRFDLTGAARPAGPAGRPAVILLLFDGVFGHALRSGIGGPLAGRGYIDYLAPGILVIVTGGVAEATAINVSTDMKEGIIARFRTMAIWQPAVLAGQVPGSLLR
jgi:hypothetical protein